MYEILNMEIKSHLNTKPSALMMALNNFLVSSLSMFNIRLNVEGCLKKYLKFLNDMLLIRQKNEYYEREALIYLVRLFVSRLIHNDNTNVLTLFKKIISINLKSNYVLEVYSSFVCMLRSDSNKRWFFLILKDEIIEKFPGLVDDLQRLNVDRHYSFENYFIVGPSLSHFFEIEIKHLCYKSILNLINVNPFNTQKVAIVFSALEQLVFFPETFLIDGLNACSNICSQIINLMSRGIFDKDPEGIRPYGQALVVLDSLISLFPVIQTNVRTKLFKLLEIIFRIIDSQDLSNILNDALNLFMNFAYTILDYCQTIDSEYHNFSESELNNFDDGISDLDSMNSVLKRLGSTKIQLLIWLINFFKGYLFKYYHTIASSSPLYFSHLNFLFMKTLNYCDIDIINYLKVNNFFKNFLIICCQGLNSERFESNETFNFLYLLINFYSYCPMKQRKEILPLLLSYLNKYQNYPLYDILKDYLFRYAISEFPSFHRLPVLDPFEIDINNINMKENMKMSASSSSKRSISVNINGDQTTNDFHDFSFFNLAKGKLHTFQDIKPIKHKTRGKNKIHENLQKIVQRNWIGMTRGFVFSVLINESRAIRIQIRTPFDSYEYTTGLMPPLPIQSRGILSASAFFPFARFGQKKSVVHSNNPEEDKKEVIYGLMNEISKVYTNQHQNIEFNSRITGFIDPTLNMSDDETHSNMTTSSLSRSNSFVQQAQQSDFLLSESLSHAFDSMSNLPNSLPNTFHRKKPLQDLKNYSSFVGSLPITPLVEQEDNPTSSIPVFFDSDNDVNNINVSAANNGTGTGMMGNDGIKDDDITDEDEWIQIDYENSPQSSAEFVHKKKSPKDTQALNRSELLNTGLGPGVVINNKNIDNGDDDDDEENELLKTYEPMFYESDVDIEEDNNLFIPNNNMRQSSKKHVETVIVDAFGTNTTKKENESIDKTQNSINSNAKVKIQAVYLPVHATLRNAGPEIQANPVIQAVTLGIRELTNIEREFPEDLFFSHIDPAVLIYLFQENDFRSIPSDDRVKRAIKVLDSIPAIETHKVGLLHITKDFMDESDFYRCTTPSSGLLEFTQLLGKYIPITECLDMYTGGLSKNGNDGDYILMFFNKFVQIVYHTPFLIPNFPEDPEFVRKKRHVGNDFVVVFYIDANVEEIPKETPIVSQFAWLEIYVQPIREYNEQSLSSLNNTRIYRAWTRLSSKVPKELEIPLNSLMLNESRVLSHHAIGAYIRDTALQANRLCVIHGVPSESMKHCYLSKWYSRKEHVLSMCKRFENNLPIDKDLDLSEEDEKLLRLMRVL
eukprot:TRINITY_DN13768_c0_g1_i1.p1 TRINITY_DN13768_c0_g1~~TRINITY_DN13768_c0_g1_i1.p1  ORF type:complete len:1299 (+),score=312.40 TRINITY_DN13768_c0_g1_i1:455-4351(+)